MRGVNTDPFDESEHPRDENGRFVLKGGETITVSERRKRVVSKLRNKVGTYKNRCTKESATLSRKNLDKLTSGKALGKSVDNGFTAQQHFEAVEKIDMLYRKSVYVGEEPDWHGRSEILRFKKYESDFRLKNGDNVLAYITIKETKNEGDKIYSVELRKK